ncbi:cupin domain-containing protein [Aquipuribacter hungaricus]|uniref:Cupin domain-containing protein n=1 Tax=Aquipuribacter hungaricus TaxID=545624 RepID=A0ABV7WK09_9MICO
MRCRAVGSDRPALARCTAVPAGQFAEQVWARVPSLSVAADLPRDFTDLLTLADVDVLLAEQGLRTPFLRVAKQGQVVPERRWTGGGGVGAGIGDQVRDDRVAEQFADGATVVLQALHRTHAPVARFATGLAADLGHPVQVNAYVTPPQNQGFASHYDVHDVFVLQVAGQKRWRLHAPVVTDPLRDDPWADHADAVRARAAEEPYLEAVLSPGDALYLPRGWLHAATALGDVSAHLTVGIHVHTRAALVEQLAALVLDDPALRATLPLGTDPSDPEDLAPHLAATVEALVRRLQDVDAGDVARRLTPSVLSGNRPAPLAPLAQAAAVASLSATSPVRLRAGLRWAVRDREDDLALVLADRTVSVPARAGDALDRLLDGSPATAADLPGLDGDDAVGLVRRLLREGVLVPAASGTTDDGAARADGGPGSR